MSMQPFKRERGASLLVSLIFLVVMAMIGITVASTTTMEERMAGHTRDRDLALQAAEAALRDAELRLADATFRGTDFPDLDPATNANTAAYWETCFAGTVSPCTVANKYTPTLALPLLPSPGGLAEAPQFVIEEKTVGTTEYFRVTARAVGGSTDTIVVLQAEIAYSP